MEIKEHILASQRYIEEHLEENLSLEEIVFYVRFPYTFSGKKLEGDISFSALTALEKLDCSLSHLTSLDVSNNIYLNLIPILFLPAGRFSMYIHCCCLCDHLLLHLVHVVP